MPASKVPRKALDDPLGKKFWPLPVSRDPSRAPMQWTSGENAGFTSGTPWLPADPSRVATCVEREQEDVDSLLSWYRRLIRLRRETRALQVGDYRSVEDAPAGVFGYVREAGAELVVVLLNFTPQRRDLARTADLGEQGWRTLLSTHRAPGQLIARGGFELAPYEVLVLEGVLSSDQPTT